MVVEIAEIRVAAENKSAFADAITRAVTTVLPNTAGYLNHTIYSCIETPGRFVLRIEWETLEAHTVGFRQSPAFAEWRAIIGPFFAQPPHVEHFDVVSQS